jgi:hypothetical protein
VGLAAYLAIQQLESNLLEPLVIEKAASFPPGDRGGIGDAARHWLRALRHHPGPVPAAMVVTDARWRAVVRSTRTASLANKEAAKEGLSQAAHLVKDRFTEWRWTLARSRPARATLWVDSATRPHRLPQPQRGSPRRLGALYAPRVHRRLEPSREELGLSVPRLALLQRRQSIAGVGGAESGGEKPASTQ